MERSEVALQQQLPPTLRNLQPAALQALHHPQTHHDIPTLSSQIGPEIPGFDTTNPNALSQHFQPDLGGPSNANNSQSTNAFEHSNHPRHYSTHANGQPQTPQQRPPHTFQQHHGGQFGVLTPQAPLPSQLQVQHSSIGPLQQEQEFFATPEQGAGKRDGHFRDLKVVPNPPNLEEWREKLFNVNETITLTEEEFQVYFPHVDNIYSHRSTQRYKRKPFVSHYWDCRLKGRPPGTPKSEDPTKKKRKRTARQRDLCDVKIKITEYFPGAMMSQELVSSGGPRPIDVNNTNNFFAPGQPGGTALQQSQSQPFGLLAPSVGLPMGHVGVAGQRYYTIQRVNGNGGNGKGDGVAGPHKHTLEESDRVKRNSVQRYMVKEEKERKKIQTLLRSSFFVPRKSQLCGTRSGSFRGAILPTKRSLATMSDKSKNEQKTYHKKATGQALNTVKKRSKENELKLFGSCFCPFVQRVWIALEVKGLNYQYIEVDPYKKPEALLEVNPRGLVPALRHGDWGCYESTVLMEYLEDLNTGAPLLPPNDAQGRAHCRLWSDHINRNIVPTFYRYLQAQELDKQIEHAEELKSEISKIVDASHPHGPFFLGPHISFVDTQFAPWMLRLSRVLKPYRGWPDPEVGSRWGSWLEAVENDEAVKATTSTDELYLDSYERYAENRPDTSQLQKAVNSGRGLP